MLKTCKDYRTILNNAFIGMAGVYDYETFWEGLERNQDLINKELQVSNGLSEIISKGVKVIPFFNWFDTGNEAGYNFANRFFNKNEVIVKPNEYIYFENVHFIKQVTLKVEIFAGTNFRGTYFRGNLFSRLSFFKCFVRTKLREFRE